MAENESTQQPGGGGFISLDQARTIALDHARGDQEFYGRRYRKKVLAWQVLSQEEREDGYHVRFSYQPARKFRGEPGVEEFTIERTGPVQSRRIITEPVGKGGFLGCGLVAAGGLILNALLIGGLLTSAL